MPRDGALVLSDLTAPKLRIHCDRCGLRRQYDLAALRQRVGDAQLPQLIDDLAKAEGCAKVPAPSFYDRCRAKIGWPGDPRLSD